MMSSLSLLLRRKRILFAIVVCSFILDVATGIRTEHIRLRGDGQRKIKALKKSKNHSKESNTQLEIPPPDPKEESNTLNVYIPPPDPKDESNTIPQPYIPPPERIENNSNLYPYIPPGENNNLYPYIPPENPSTSGSPTPNPTTDSIGGSPESSSNRLQNHGFMLSMIIVVMLI